jgi:beta-glucosidase
MGWPASDVNAVDDNLAVADFAFERGYGLSVDSNVQTIALSEEALWEPFDQAMPIFSLSLQDPWENFAGDTMEWNTPLGARGGQSKTGALTVSVTDHRVQEDARQLVWSGSSDEIVQFFYQAAEAVNMAKLEKGHGALVFDVRVVEPPTGEVALRMDCGWPCSGSLEVSGLLDSLALEEWLRVAVPLSCFKVAGADMRTIDTPFLLATKDAMVVEVGEVILTADTAGTVWWACDDAGGNA